MTHVLHFETSFWSQKQPSSTSPDFYSGLSVLHQKLQQSRVENDEVITFFKDRIAIEESYGNKLLDQARESSKTTGFGRDEGAALKSCFENLKTASGQLGARHHITATTMTESALKPLQAFHEDYKKTLTTSRSSVEAKIKQFDGLLKETERAKALYHRRCREADAAEEQAAFMAVEELHKGNEKQPSAAPPPSKSQSVQLGTQTFSPGEFDLLLQRMRQEIPTKDHRIPILGTYKATSTGEEVSRWLQLHLPQCKDSPAMADIVGQQLIQNHNVLRLIGQRGNKFLPSNTSVYQWRIRDPEEVASLGVSALGGILEKIGSGANGYASVQGDELYKRARLEAEKTDEAYRSAVKRLDTMRTVIEEALFSHFSEMEKVELTRLDTLKQVFSTFTSCLSAGLPEDKAVLDQVRLFLESLTPEKDIQYIVHHYCTSGFSPKAMVYENFYHGIAHDQLFGVPLEELGKQTPDKVPLFVRQVLDTIAQGVKETPLEDKISLWSTPVALSTVHTARAEMNMDSRRLEPALVDSYSPGLLVAVLRLFLLELPEPLMTYDLYESVCALYTNDNQDESLRLLPLSHLIATLPASHFYTLDLLLSHIDSHLQTCQGRSLEETSQCLGPIFLRARTESLATLTSQVPFQLTRDLLQHYKHIFSENTRHSFAENEKRRQTRPLVKAGSFVEGDSKKNGLMSFMRPTEDTPKWGMPSVMGVFQRSPYSPILPTTDTRTYVPTSLHFGSAITQTSPPSSPALSPTQDPFVMFDLEDHLFTSSTDKDTAAIATATATTTAAEGELDPFFADD